VAQRLANVEGRLGYSGLADAVAPAELAEEG